MASSCSFDKFPGTNVTSIGNDPELLDNWETSGPGPLLSAPSPRTRIPTWGSSFK